MSDKYEDLRKIIQEELLSEDLLKEKLLKEMFGGQASTLDGSDFTIDLHSEIQKFLNAIKPENLKKISSEMFDKIKSAIASNDVKPEEVAEEINAQLDGNAKVDVLELSPEAIFEDNFNRLLETEIDFAPGTKISLAGLCLLLVVTDNSLKESKSLESSHTTFRRVMSYLYKYLNVNGNNIEELQTEATRRHNLQYSVKITNPNFDDLKNNIYSAGGFAYEIAFASLLRINIESQVNKPENMNRIAPLYAYYIASLDTNGKSTTETLRKTLEEIFKSGNNVPLFEAFKGVNSYDNLIKDLIEALSILKITNYVDDIQKNIQSVLDGQVTYKMHPSPTGIFDIIASNSTNHIKFDIKTTINVEGIAEPTGRQVHRWKDETKDTLYYGIVSIIIDRIKWNLPYVLHPTGINGGAVSHNAIARDLAQLTREELDSGVSLTYFPNSIKSPGKTIGIFKIPSDNRSFSDFPLNGNNTGESLSISDIATLLDDQGKILSKSNIKQLSSKMIELYSEILKKYPSLNDILIQKKGAWRISSDNNKIARLDRLNHDIKKFLTLLINLGDFLQVNNKIIFTRQTPKNQPNIKGIFLDQKSINMLKVNEQNYGHKVIDNIVAAITKYFENDSTSNAEGESNQEDEGEVQSILASKPDDSQLYTSIINTVFPNANTNKVKHVEIANTLINYVHKIYYLIFHEAKDSIFMSIRQESYNTKGNILLERDIRLLVRRLLEEGDKKSYSGSHPEESYGWSAKEEDFMFDKPGLTTWEEDRKWVKQYLKSMGLLAKK